MISKTSNSCTVRDTVGVFEYSSDSSRRVRMASMVWPAIQKYCCQLPEHIPGNGINGTHVTNKRVPARCLDTSCTRKPRTVGTHNKPLTLAWRVQRTKTTHAEFAQKPL